MARTGFLDPELSPQQLLDRQLITAEDMLTPNYAEADAVVVAGRPRILVVSQALQRSSTWSWVGVLISLWRSFT
jgi:hypothetical protein